MQDLEINLDHGVMVPMQFAMLASISNYIQMETSNLPKFQLFTVKSMNNM